MRSRDKVRVAHVTTVHRPFDTRIFHKQCVTLAAAGYDVTLIQEGDKREVVKGVSIEPLPQFRNRLDRSTRGVWFAMRRALKSRAEVVHFHDAEFIWGGLILKALGRKLIYDVHEDVAKDMVDKAYMPRWAIPPLHLAVWMMEWLAQRAFDRVSAATRSISDRFATPKTILIRNTPIIGELSFAGARAFRDRPPYVGYMGGLAGLNGTEQMVTGIGQVAEELGVRLLLAGKFVDSDIERLVRSSAGWRRVEYLGWLDRPQVGPMLAKVRCGLVLYQPSPNVISAEPNKFFEYLSSGLPVVASDYPLWRAFIEEFQCGLVVDPRDPAAIAAAIERLIRNPDEAEAMGRRGREAVVNEYNWGKDGAKLVRLYDDISGAGDEVGEGGSFAA